MPETVTINGEPFEVANIRKDGTLDVHRPNGLITFRAERTGPGEVQIIPFLHGKERRYKGPYGTVTIRLSGDPALDEAVRSLAQDFTSGQTGAYLAALNKED
jgi:hypothetical protein